MGFFVTGKRGTIRGPTRFNATDACLKLFQGMKGLGTDEAAITSVVSGHTSKQRQKIRDKYMQVYKKDLLKELDGELSSNFGTLVAAMMIEPEEFMLECLHRAVVHQSVGGKLMKRISAMFKDGLGKTEYSLLSIVCPRTNEELEQIKEAFSAKYGLQMEEKIALGGNDLPQDFCTLILDLLSGERQEDEQVDMDLVEEDADNLNGDDGNEDAFQEMMQERSFPHLRKVFEEYEDLTGKPIADFVEESGQFTLELKQAYKGMILLLTNQPEFYADRLHRAIKGAGTDDDTLIRVVVLRSEVDLLDIMEVYERKFGISLADDVAGDTSGDYKDILLRIIAVPPPEPAEVEKKPRRAARRRGATEKAATTNEMEKVEEQPDGGDEEVKETKVTPVRQQRRLCKTKAAKSAEAPPPELQDPEEVEEEEEEEKPVEVKKPIRKRGKPKKAFKKAVHRSSEAEASKEEEAAGEVVEEEVAVTKVSEDNAAVAIDPVEEIEPEEKDVDPEAPTEDDGQQNDADEEDGGIEEEDEEEETEEKADVDEEEIEADAEPDEDDTEEGKCNSEGDEEQKEEEETADETTPTLKADEEKGKGSTSPIISREL